jgi:heptosyltransferase-2
MNTVAIFLPNWVGDVVMATPAVRALREAHPTARFIGICKPYVADVLGGTPWFDELRFLDRRGSWRQRWPAVAWGLRGAGVDLAVLFPNSLRSALAAWLGGCRERVGFDRYGRGGLLTIKLEHARDASGRFKPTPIIDDYNRLAVAAGCPWPGHRMELFTTPADERAADAVWAKLGLGGEVVCLNPGAAFGAAKYWPAESFAMLARDLVERRGSRVLVLCGPAERDLARRIVETAARPGVASIADEPLSLGLTKALVRRCALLVTTDSGPRHFAAALDRPVVSLFGPTHIAWTETYFAKAVHLQERVPCGPCQQRVCPTDHACMTRLTPEKVFAAAGELLARPNSTPLPLVPPERKAS